MRKPAARVSRFKFNRRNNSQALRTAAAAAAPAPARFESLEDRRLFSVVAHYYNDGFWGNGDGNAGRPTAPINQSAGQLTFDKQTISVARAGDVRTTVDAIDFDWGLGSPAEGIRPDNHSTLFVGKLVAPTAGTYEILGFGDDDVHVFVDGQLVSSDPLGHGQADPRSTGAVNRGGGAKAVTLAAGNHELIVLHAEQGGGSGVRLRWVQPGGDSTAPTVVPAENLLAEVTPVTAPTGLSRDATEAYGVKINFTDTSNTELRYDLQRRQGTGAWATVATGHINDTSITDYSVRPGQTYQYRVVAWNLQGEAVSTETVTAPFALPAATGGAQGYYFNDQWWKAGAPRNTAGTGVVVGTNPDFSENVGDINENYGDGNGTTPGSPEPGVIRNDQHSTVFVGKITAPETGDYLILGFSDDDSYVYVNGQLVSADPGGHGIPVNAYDTVANNGIETINVRNTVNLTAGQEYDVVFVHSEGGGGSGAILRWVLPSELALDPKATPFEVPAGAFTSNQNYLPAAPTELQGVATDVGVIRLSWKDNSTGEVRQVLERSTVNGDFSNATRTLLPINATSYQDTGLTRGTTYYYRLVAENFTGTSAPATASVVTPAASPAPAAPANLVVYNVGTQNIVSFTDNSTNEAGFVLERRLASGGTFAPVTGSPVAGSGPNVTGGTISFTDTTDVVGGQTYVYRVRAVNVDNVESPSVEATSTVQGLRATIYDSTGRFGARNFYDNPAPGIDPVVRQDPTVNFDFGGNGPVAGVDGDLFSVVWEGYFTPEVTGPYTFFGESDDGIRVFVDGQRVVDQWVDRGTTETAGTPVDLTAGVPVEIRVQYYENGGGAVARLRYEAPGVAKAIVPVGRLTPANGSNPLRAPSNVEAVSNLGEGVVVTWVDNSASESGFRVERSTDGATFEPIATVPANQSGYIDTNDLLTDYSLLYYYRAVALGAGGAEEASQPSQYVYPYEAVSGPVNFADFSSAETQQKWTLNSRGPTGAGTFVDSNGDSTLDRLRLTDGGTDNALDGQYASAYLSTPVTFVEGFTSSFDFVVGGEGAQSANPADGFTWVLQAANGANSVAPARTAAIGAGGGGLGYAGLGNSVALKFDIYNNLNQTGLYVNGNGISDDPADPRNRVVPAEFDINSGTPLRVTVAYDPTSHVLTQTIDDIGNAATAPFVTTYTVDLGATIGQGSAFVGFTGATGGETARQEILSFAFDPTAPAPAPVSPLVSQVYVKGSAWAARFMNELVEDGVGSAEYGYRVDNLDPTAANSTLPWINTNQVVLVYDRDLAAGGVPQAGSFTLNGIRSSYNVTNVQQLGSRAVVLTLDRALGNLPGAGSDGDRVTLTVNGGGAGGAAHTEVLNVLQGDVNRAGNVVNSFGDLAFVRARLNRNVDAEGTGASYTVWSDINASGDINSFGDLAGVRARLNDSLPPAGGAAAAGLFSEERVADLVL